MKYSKIKAIVILLCVCVGFINVGYGQHFQNPESTYNPMTIIVMTADIGGTPLEVGDEIAAFDNGICVGFSTVVDAAASPLVSITAFQNESGTANPNGYVPGDNIMFRIWDVSDQSEITSVCCDFNPAFLSTYEGLGTAIANTVSGTGSLRTDIASVVTCPGDVAVNVNVSNYIDVANFSLRLDYTSTEVVYQDFENLNANLDASLFSITNNNDHLLITYTGTADLTLVNGILVALNFEALTTTVDITSDLTWNAGQYNNAMGDMIPVNFFDGTITVNPLPVQPDDIVGLAQVCQASEDVGYTINEVAGALSYSWSVEPVGAATISGNGTAIELDFDATFTGDVTLSVYAANACGDGEAKDVSIDVIENPSITMRSDFDNCVSDPVQLSSPSGAVTATNYSTLSWTSSGDGVFDDVTVENPVYTPGANDIANGNVILTLEAIANAPCTSNATESVTVTFIPLPEASLPDDTDLCEGETITISGVASNYLSLEWLAVDSDGELVQNNPLEVDYTPGPGDMDQGFVVIQLQASSLAPCSGSDVDQMTINLQKKPDVLAGADGMVCEDGTYQLNPVVLYASDVLWSTSGDGAFDDESLEDAVYTPGVNDIANGMVSLTISASSILPCVSTETSVMTLEIFSNPSLDSLTDEVACSSEAFLLNANAANYSTSTWTTSGDGSFDDVNIINAEYTPGPVDIENGLVILTLTVDGQGGCNEIDDSMQLTIQAEPLVNAGSNNAICTGSSFQLTEATVSNTNVYSWTTSGDGSFDDDTLLNPEYTPGVNDIANGTVTLSIEAEAQFPCTLNVTDAMVLSIMENPVVDAGSGGDFCEGVTCQLEGATGSNYSGVIWTTSGDGVFVDATLLNPQYVAGSQDALEGTVTLTVEASPNAPCVGVVSDSRMFTVYPAVDLSLNTNAQICEDETCQLDATVENYSTITWSSDGDGSFSNLNIPNPVYTPGLDDINSGNVTLTISVIGEGTCTSAVSAELDLDIQGFAEVDAGDDEVVCEDQSVDLEANAQNYSGISWSTNGDGAFSETNILDPVYTPGSDDIANGTVTLNIEVEAEAPCSGTVSDELVISITSLAEVDAGDDVEICADDVVYLSGNVINSNTYTWTTSGDGTIANPNSLNASYISGTNDIINGTATLTLTVDNASPCTGTVDDEVIITINNVPDQPVGLTGDQTIIILDPNVPVYGNYSTLAVATADTYTWSLDPDDAGSILSNGSEDVAIEWSPDYSGGIVELFVSAVNGCGNSEISEAFEVEVDNQIGIDALGERYNFKILPNPAIDYIHISFDIVNKGVHEVLIYDKTARLMLKRSVVYTQERVMEKIDLSTLPQGIYTIVLNDGKSQIIQKIVVID